MGEPLVEDFWEDHRQESCRERQHKGGLKCGGTGGTHVG